VKVNYIKLHYIWVLSVITLKARNEVELRILEDFDEKLKKNEDISPSVKKIIRDSLRETTISQSSKARELAEEMIKVKEDALE